MSDVPFRIKFTPGQRPRRLALPEHTFGPGDAMHASNVWGANCGPGALAAILGLHINAVHGFIPGFDEKKYTNPTMMKQALERLGVKWRDRSANDPNNYADEMAEQDPGGVSLMTLKPTDYRQFKSHALVRYGLVRIQFEPWYGRLAYHFTHWVGAAEFRLGVEPAARTDLFVFDINYGWRRFDDWAAKMPELAKDASPKSDGNWHATHRWELDL